jgi:hypothetical protein
MALCDDIIKDKNTSKKYDLYRKKRSNITAKSESDINMAKLSFLLNRSLLGAQVL